MSDTDVETTPADAEEKVDGTARPDSTPDTGAVDDADADVDAADSDDAEETDDDEPAESLLVQEGDIAADYLERLLDIVDYDGDIDLDVENDRAAVAIVGSDLTPLVGARGEVLDALQELTRLAVQQQTGIRSRLMLDISGHRSARRDELQTLARETAARVVESGEPSRLTPMNPFERKVVHDVISSLDGVVSESEGEEPHRRVVVLAQR